MIVVYCFHPGDQELALTNAKWIRELGGCHGHELLGAYDPRCDIEIANAIRRELAESFDKLWQCPALVAVDGWPQGANYFFRITTEWLSQREKYPSFLWLEPDAIPIRESWLDAIEAEHKRGGKPFTGERVDLGEKRPDVPVHMSGVAVYQNPIYMLAGECSRAHDTAWDIAAKDQIIPNAHFTKLIQHYWKHGTFTSLDGVRPETVIFHSSKDGSLIDRLREKRGGTTTMQEAAGQAASNTALPIQKEPDSGSPSPPSPSSIRILPHTGFWVLEGDTIISEMVEREGHLDFDPLIPHILGHIKPGDTVVDVGAFIGDHTIAYARAVGKAGKVLAYEPNLLAFQCLVHNTDKCGNVFTFCHALGAQREVVELTDLPNAASNYIGAGGRHVHVRPLDEDASLFGQIDLVKIDVEGYELKVLKGMEQLINKFHPRMVIEINEIALERQGHFPAFIFDWLIRHGYQHSVLYQHKDAPFYDILAEPVTAPVEELPMAPPSTRDRVKSLIAQLREISDQSPMDKAIVMQHLVINGLRKPNKSKAAYRKRKQSAKKYAA